MTHEIGDSFQEQTKYHRDHMSGGGLDWSRKPDIYKEYPDAIKKILPLPEAPSAMTLDRALRLRHSVRRFREEPLLLSRLSYLLWAATGIQRREQQFDFRTVPSAGALYPIETYLVVNRVERLAQGVYHYSIKGNVLDELALGDYSRRIMRAALDQVMCVEAPVVVVWTALFQRSKWKYRERAYRYVYLDAGHIGQNLALAATSLGLGSCQIGALYDDEVNAIIGVDGKTESVLYMSVVGKPL